MTRRCRALWRTGAISLAFAVLTATVLAYSAAGQTPDADVSAEVELIDPDCEPDRAKDADPAIVELPDGVCHPDRVPPFMPGPGQAPVPPTPPERTDGSGEQGDQGAAESDPRADRGRPQRRAGSKRKARRKKRESAERRGGAGARPRHDSARKRRGTGRARSRTRAHARSRRGTLAVNGVPSFATGASRMPVFLLPVYRAAAARYGIAWEVLAAINEIETDYGRNLNVSSAGAVGWMQFMPSSWRRYGVDADRDGRKDPYDPIDAIFAAARYLKAAGYENDVRGAIFAYNHADWYVDAVLLRARLIAGAGLALPEPLPRARRLDLRFARDLKQSDRRTGVDWQLTLAVLRARGKDGRVPASRSELRRLTRRLAVLGARRHPGLAIRRLAGTQAFSAKLELPALTRKTTLVERIVALTKYNRAVGLSGLVRGLEAVRERLARRTLRSKGLKIYPGGRADIRTGVTDVRVLVLMLYLANRYDEVEVTSLTTGHSRLTASGNVSAHSVGRALDIAALNGKPILGHQDAGGLAERALWRIMLLPKELQPKELISLFELGGPSFALADHDDHIHVGF